MTDISRFGFPDDMAFARYLVKEIGLCHCARIELLQSQYKADGTPKQVRFTFCKKDQTLDVAEERLSHLRAS